MHCGDFEALFVCRYLKQLAQMVAVRGNMDEPVLKEVLSETFTFEAVGRKIGVVHGYSAPVAWRSAWRPSTPVMPRDPS